MKRNVILAAIALGVYYLIREITGKKEVKSAPRQNHLTSAFSRAKSYANNASAE